LHLDGSFVFERFTDQARRVVVLAQEEARALSHRHIGTEHMLLGLINERDGVAAKALESVGISPEAVRVQVEEIVGRGQDAPNGHIPFTPRAKKLLDLALREALQLGHSDVGTEHLLLGLIREGEGAAIQVLHQLNADLDEVRQQVIQILGVLQDAEDDPGRESSIEARLGRNLTREARQGKLDPVIGRDREIDQVMQILSRRRRICPVLTGDGSASVLTVIEGMAQSIVKGLAPLHLKNADVYLVDAQLVVQSGGRAKFHESLRNALGEAGPSALVALTGLPALIGSDSEAATAVSRLMTDPLDGGGARLIVIASAEESREVLEGDPRLAPFFERVHVTEPTVSHAIEMLKGVRERFEAHHRLTITDEALEAAVTLATRFVQDGYLPETAIDLLDEAGALMRIRRMTPPHLTEYDEKIAEVRIRKGSAIDSRDFETAARLRDEEKQLIGAKGERETAWRAAELDEVTEVDEDVILEVVSLRSGRPASEVRRTLAERNVDTKRAVSPDPSSAFTLLNDVPISAPAHDLLGMRQAASDISSLLAHAPTPFAFAVDATWGMGKSSLLRQIDEFLPSEPAMVRTHFNAWTSQGDNALEALIRSVLRELDPSILRRSAKRLAKRRNVVSLIRIGFTVFGRFIGISRLVDELWTQLGGDTNSRNELRTAIQGMLGDWVASGGTDGRTLVVFVDDLDRCSDEVVVQVCEAVKLYLDAPGLVFILACDMSVIARGVGVAARGGAGEGRTYLEKIIQVAYRLPPPSKTDLANLVRGYSASSGTSHLMEDAIADILVERCGGNPRRIKRILNSFVLENRLNDAWGYDPLDRVQLISVIILQHLYPDFFDWLTREDAGDDPVGEFLEYASFRRRAADTHGAGERWWADTARLFRRHELGVPTRRNSPQEMSAFVDSLDRLLPSRFPELTTDVAFIALLETLGDSPSRRAVRSQLVRRPLQAATTP
jgi:hypothetical protein